MNNNSVKCLICGTDTEYDFDCPVCGWEMDSGLPADNGEEIGPPNYFKASDYKRFWRLSGKDRNKMFRWWEFMAAEAKNNPEYWSTADEDKKSELYAEMIKKLENLIQKEAR